MLVHFSSLAKRIPEGFYPIIKLKEEEEEKRLLNLVEIWIRFSPNVNKF